MNLAKHLALLLLPALASFSLPLTTPQPHTPYVPAKPLALDSAGTAWVDSMMAVLTPEQRLGQLIVMDVSLNEKPEKEAKYYQELEQRIRDYHVGSVIFFSGELDKAHRVLHRLQRLSTVPMMATTDGEWGLAMRFVEVEKLPYQMTLGAIQDDSLIYTMGRTVADQFVRLGLHMNLAPVADVNNNPDNPVISFRSFGEDRHNVARKAVAYAQGMQDGGILAVAKHFPGHGDTDVDSHYDLPAIHHTPQRLDSVELYPFRRLIASGAAGIMTAHLHVHALDTVADMPSTLSRATISGLLQDSLGFSGLVMTDALKMKAVEDRYPSDTVGTMALLAGNTMLEVVRDWPAAMAGIHRALASGALRQEDIDAQCRRVLAAKYLVGLHRGAQPTPLHHLYEDLNAGVKAINPALCRAALTTLNRDTAAFTGWKEGTVVVMLGDFLVDHLDGVADPSPELLHILDHRPASLFHPAMDSLAQAYDNFQVFSKELPDLATMQQAEQIVIYLGDDRRWPFKELTLTDKEQYWLKMVAPLSKTTVVLASMPYQLNHYPFLAEAPNLLVGYQLMPAMERAMLEWLASPFDTSGKLPVSLGEVYPLGAGL